MARLVGSCPGCGTAMAIRRLECPACDISVEGTFDAGPLARLSPEQTRFVEAFLRARGKIKDVEEDLGISYPTVVARLGDVLAAMGFEPGDDARESERRQRILDDLASGRIGASEAASLLREPGTPGE